MSQMPLASVATPRIVKVIGALLILLNLGVAVAVAWSLDVIYRQHVRRAEIATQNLSEALEDNVRDTIRGIDLTLQSLQDEAVHDPRGLRQSVLTQAFQRTGNLTSLQVADRTGRVIYAVPGEPAAAVSSQAFFRQFQETERDDLFISSPVPGPGGTWNLILARRIQRAGGGFAGAVYALLPTEQLARTMSRLDVGRWGSVSLRGADLGLLARYPDFAGRSRLIGDTHVSGAYQVAIRSGHGSAQFTETSVLDGIRRTYTLRRSDSPVFYIQVGLAQQEYLQAWRHQAALAAGVVLGLVGLTLALGWQARSSWIRYEKDQERLATQEAKYRLLAENATDVIWSMDPDGNLTYVSPAILQQRGWSPEEFMASKPEVRAVSGKAGESFQKRLDEIRRLPPGSQPAEEDLLQTTVARKDGLEIHVEIQCRAVWGEDGCLLGFQGVTRDITARKRMEVERERLIQSLTQALADVKQLSGMLPICSSCKKVRDDHGYWSQIETYLSEHTEATFTHGVCPDCAQRFREEIQARRAQRTEGDAP